MFSAVEAESLIFTLITPVRAVETVSLDSCLHRVLAVPVISPIDFPHWDNSAMDGYAVRASDVRSLPATLHVIEEIPAGKAPEKTVQPGQAARILTGAMMPAGADTVVMQENTARQADDVTILDGADIGGTKRGPEPGKFVRQQGSYLQAGSVLLAAGRTIEPAEIAILAAAQQTQVEVFRRPRVAILSTGSELVEPDQPLGPGQIVDSNQYALTALVAQTG
ncbi:MAG: molybdopterin molybdotransferase MoeA, partial [Cyanobacteria bacterium J06632_3]